jgi:metallo-beta-lactamase family protein
MNAKISFFGAAQNVTGSKYLLETGSAKVLVDCGMFQERKLKDSNWDKFPFKPKELDAVILTHAHIDHSGLLPRLVKAGFRGKIHCTEATAEIVKVLLADSGRIQEEDAKFKIKRHLREGRKSPRPIVPLYTEEDAKQVFPFLKTTRYRMPVEAAPGMTAEYFDAGHILGSAMVNVTLTEGAENRKILFSGDVGRWGSTILRDPTCFESADYLTCESTYGDRLHDVKEDKYAKLERIVKRTVEAGGNLVIPSFGVERAQDLLYVLSALLKTKRIPPITVFMDSPMAINITEIFKRYEELFDDATKARLKAGDSPFDFRGLQYTRSTDESKNINFHKGSAIIIAGNGMCTGGRVKHHLVQNITRSDSTVLFVGYQASGTLGRIILEGASRVRILGREFPVSARIEKINGFSAHADRDELARWLSCFKNPPRRLFVTHGEPATAKSFAEFWREKSGWQIQVPAIGDFAPLD